MPPNKGMWRVRVERGLMPRSERRVEPVWVSNWRLWEMNRRCSEMGIWDFCSIWSFRVWRVVVFGFRFRVRVLWLGDVMNTIASGSVKETVKDFSLLEERQPILNKSVIKQ